MGISWEHLSDLAIAQLLWVRPELAPEYEAWRREKSSERSGNDLSRLYNSGVSTVGDNPAAEVKEMKGHDPEYDEEYERAKADMLYDIECEKRLEEVELPDEEDYPELVEEK